VKLGTLFKSPPILQGMILDFEIGNKIGELWAFRSINNDLVVYSLFEYYNSQSHNSAFQTRFKVPPVYDKV
jgi:hypothetical protein